MFTPHPNLADDVNHAIVQSEIEGGVFLHDLPPSTILEIQTLHHCYTAVLLGGSEALLSGHPEFCPSPVQVAIAGSTWGGSMLKLQYVGRGMHLEFRHPETGVGMLYTLAWFAPKSAIPVSDGIKKSGFTKR